ncbi:MAG: hypothetical protein RLZZ515_2045 [Cyanobacteriota bacterium]|jgi:transcriptional regulator NrdR family protein
MSPQRFRMVCPECGARRTAVRVTRHLSDGLVIRRRHCLKCDYRWYTKQPAEESLPPYAVGWCHDLPYLV